MKRFMTHTIALLVVLFLQGCLFDSSPVHDTYTIGGTISGLDNGTVVLQNNGDNDLSISENGDFTFVSPLQSGESYHVTVYEQPEGQHCSIEHGSGIVADDNISSVRVICEEVVPESYTIGGSVSGLVGSITLQNNGGNDVTLNADGNFSFPAQSDGSTYAVTIASAPATQTCTLSNGSGTLVGADITNVNVTCTTNTYTVGGNVSGLNGTVVLQNNAGDDLSLTDDGSFVFGTALADGSDYSIAVKTQPADQTCSINHPSGTINGADVGNVEVNCLTNTYTVGGSLTGLDSGESVVLQNNGGDDLNLSTDGNFVFLTLLTDGAHYRVTVKTSLTEKTCSVVNAEGTIDSSNITDVEVTCSVPTGDLRADVENLGEGRQLELNVTISKDAAVETNRVTLTGTVSSGGERFTLEDTIEAGSDYNVSITIQPEERVCTANTTRNGTVTSTHLHPVVEISCKNAPRPSTRPFVITVKPQLRNGEYIYAFIKKGSLPYLYDVDCDSDGINEGESITTNFNCVYPDNSEQNISVLGIFPSIQGDYHDCNGLHHILSVEQWGDQQWMTMEEAFFQCKEVVFHATDKPDLSKVTSMKGMFEQSDHFNSPLNDWNVSSVTDMDNMFSRARDFNQPLNNWNVSSVTNMHSMFNQTDHFNQPLNDWNVSSVTNMSSMFGSAKDFNQSLNHWDVHQVDNMNSMFQFATSFNQPLNDWNVSGTHYMRSMFYGAQDFNQSLNDWNVSGVQDMVTMFQGATSFNHPLNDWNVSSVTEMRGMFQGATSFNQPLNDWNVSSVTNMNAIFYRASSFNQPLNDWDVSHVTSMYVMFESATSFNQPLYKWNVSRVTNMSSMFNEATSFYQDISNWDVSGNPSHTNFAQNSPIEGTSYEPSWP